jgi:cytochrome bd ubiquinol oxidase subunit II
MTEYALLQLLGWLVVGAVMFLFAATAGFDFGAGMLLPFLARGDEERRTVINVVGPTWDGNQVWLITLGGAIFAIWPRVYAASFSGFYFAMLLLLWSLFLRPVAFEYRSKMKSKRWRSFWDWGLFVGSLVPVLIIGVAMGNVLLGVPFHYDALSVRFFYSGTFWGLLRGFPILVGVVCICMLLMHGAAYVAMRTEGVVYERAKRAVRFAAWGFILTFAAAGIWVGTGINGFHVLQSKPDAVVNTIVSVPHGWMSNYTHHVWFILAPIVAFISALFVFFFAGRSMSRAAFVASVFVPAGTIATVGFSMFPVIFPSNTHPAQSLILWNASSSLTALTGILATALIMLPIIFIYTAFVYRKLWGRGRRLSPQVVREEEHTLY